jgi:phosphoribosylglycinamide formyltransferase 1
MVVAAHPDDEILGCGATAHKLVGQHWDAQLSVCKIVAIHQGLLPRGAGAVPIANAILHGVERTGCHLFWVDGGMDAGPIIGQLAALPDPRATTATELFAEATRLGGELLRMYGRHINNGTATAIPQDLSKRITYRKVKWSDWPEELVKGLRTYLYV